MCPNLQRAFGEQVGQILSYTRFKAVEISEREFALSSCGKKKIKTAARWNLLLQLEYAARIPAGQRANKPEIMSN